VAVSKPKTSRLYYLLLGLPLALAFLSWWGFPTLAQELSTAVFGYEPLARPAGLLWYAAVMLYYTWFTFLSVGIGGMLGVGAWLSRRQAERQRMVFYPMVSFVVPAFNEERELPRCVDSLFECAARYPGLVEVIIVDDGSVDSSYEVAYASVDLNLRKHPGMRGRVVRHMVNLGKVEALRSGANCALGQLIAVVDADSWWRPEALQSLVEYMQANGKAAVTGYVHPSDGEAEETSLVVLQQLEYSQGLSVFRCAQALGNSVTVVPGAIGLFEASVFRDILNEKELSSVAEDSEITLELQKRGYGVGYLNSARGGTVAPSDFGSFWGQRLRWFVGWLHNTLGVHRDVLLERRWLSLLLWYSLIVEYLGAFIEFAAVVSFPFLFWFAPDKISFLLNLLWFGGYALLVGVTAQAIALRFAYGEYNHKWLLYYTPFYSILWFVNLWARLVSVVRYAFGYRGRWHPPKEESVMSSKK
jgi:cellulose synthase/poly-beta-1,6-N-acetylglucosamine synthase-like glycosyltransferase